MSAKPIIAAALAVWLTISPEARAFDVLRTESAIPATPADAIVPDAGGCLFAPPGNPLLLGEAVERALCNNPKTREAWADVKAQAAGLGIARSAYLPTVAGTAQLMRDDSVTNVAGHPSLSSASTANLNSESISLNWTLYDFGARSASVTNASALLAAAHSMQDATLQTLFVTVAKDYYAAQAAAGALAALDVERMAADSAKVAAARVDRGIAPISDALQAQTAYTQAVLSRNKAHGAWQTAAGALAADLALSPDVPLQLPPVTNGVKPDAAFAQSVSDLMDDARRTHPTVLAAQAQVDAAAAKVEQTRAEGLPNLSLVSKYSRDNQPASLGLGVAEFPSTGHEWYVGLQLTIPFFSGFSRTYQVRQTQAQLEHQQDALDDARQQVGLEVWNSYQAVQTSMNGVKDSTTLFDIAQRSFTVAQRRYQAGVGNILELLNAQTALANAQQQRIQALTDWRASRLRLAGSLGRLETGSVVDQ
ncbi:TolC family protein [Paraburkholderia sp. BL17N1]|uniref:TolC family protein n=1 Tax=Paraburkholderia sp. BL17N1 TaxID=1938798 RepID=UPI000F2530E1|nr:TolC family protein [Paraburkholderia sp. BL17N1]RKR38206.1 outer membrane protein [Paraburkholderia sp. BL17N1]